MSLGTELVVIGHLPQKPRCNPRMELFVQAQLDHLQAQCTIPNSRSYPSGSDDRCQHLKHQFIYIFTYRCTRS
ncbi:Mannosyl-oligosaccharide 1,2-alpha-mannosidase [Fusarium oxysporum f. sp. albedinis]|nr:Mannosyl-oligosaccharide 1,2-alpha-mannosidase [Fusarium oxysporum f. sp. albedinis]